MASAKTNGAGGDYPAFVVLELAKRFQRICRKFPRSLQRRGYFRFNSSANWKVWYPPLSVLFEVVWLLFAACFLFVDVGQLKDEFCLVLQQSEMRPGA